MDNRVKRGAELMKQTRENTSKGYRAELLKGLVTSPVILFWSDGSQSETTLEQAFTTEEDYSRYQSYKRDGKAYPVRVEATDGAEEALKTMCQSFTKALRQYVEGAEI